MKNKLKKKIIMSTLAIAISITPVLIPNKLIVANANPSDQSININQRSTKTGVVKSCDFLNVRNGAGSNNAVVGKVYTNDQVSILETSSNGWHKISTSSGVTGWVSGSYITVQNTQTSTNQGTTNQSSTATKVLDVAKKQLGKPYGWGSAGPNSFDCSGLVYYSYKNGANITLPRSSRDQAKVGKAVNKNQLQPGDLVFFATAGGKSISHVGIYVGDNKFIHSTQPGDVIKIDSMTSSYYTKTYVTARRVL